MEDMNIPVLEIVGNGFEARVATADLYRLVSLPSGRVVKELLDVYEAGGKVSGRESKRESDAAEWWVAIEYPVLAALTMAGVSIESATIKPGPAKCCGHCLAPRIESEPDVLDQYFPRRAVWACGRTFEKNRDDNVSDIRTDECREREQEHHRRIDAVNAIVQSALAKAGITYRLVDAHGFYGSIMDGRDDRTGAEVVCCTGPPKAA